MGSVISNWLIVLFILAFPALIGVRSRSLFRALMWSSGLAIGVVGVEEFGHSDPDRIANAVRYVLVFVGVAAIAYGIKRLVKRSTLPAV